MRRPNEFFVRVRIAYLFRLARAMTINVIFQIFKVNINV